MAESKAENDKKQPITVELTRKQIKSLKQHVSMSHTIFEELNTDGLIEQHSFDQKNVFMGLQKTMRSQHGGTKDKNGDNIYDEKEIMSNTKMSDILTYQDKNDKILMLFDECLKIIINTYTPSQFIKITPNDIGKLFENMDDSSDSDVYYSLSNSIRDTRSELNKLLYKIAKKIKAATYAVQSQKMVYIPHNINEFDAMIHHISNGQGLPYLVGMLNDKPMDNDANNDGIPNDEPPSPTTRDVVKSKLTGLVFEKRRYFKNTSEYKSMFGDTQQKKWCFRWNYWCNINSN